MKIASTDTQQYRHHQINGKEREQNRNFWIAVLQSTFMRISFAFADPCTVLSAFVYKLTSSNTFVGLTGSLMSVGWMWPQLFISNLLEHRPRKMPFYILGMSIRIAAWLAIFLCTHLIGARNDSLLATSFIYLYFISTSSLGVSTVPYMDIISKAIEPHRRARVFSLGNFIGGSCTGFIGYFFIRHILSDKSGLAFPNNYALLFSGVVVAGGVEFLIFLNLHEPIRPVRAERRSFWQHLKQGPHFLRTDRNYQWFLMYRIGINIARMCMPFYVPYALSHFKVPGETIGLFLAVSAVSGVLSNALWGYVGERYGVRWILIGTSLLVCTAPLVAVENDIFPFNRGTDFEYDSVETLDSIECEVIESVFRANAAGVIMSVLSCFLHIENSIDISSVKIHLGKGMS